MGSDRSFGILFQGEMVRAIHRPADHPLCKRVTRRTSGVWAKRRVGDLLWVRETFQAHALSGAGEPVELRYRADNATRRIARAPDDTHWTEPPRWTPSLLMPRWASRTTLRITELDPEPGIGQGGLVPLPHVTDAEARLEGVEDRAAYLRLWREINGDDYPETLWRIGFEVVDV